MSSFKTLLIFFMICSLSEISQASFILSPSVGLRTHHLKLTDLSGNDSTLPMSAPAYGLELGYRTSSGIDVSVDYEAMSGQSEWSPATDSVKFSQSSAAARLGISSLSLLRIYLGYGFLNDLKIDKGLTHSDLELQGISYQAGVQFRLWRGIALGAQYNLNTFQKISGTNYLSQDSIEKYYRKVDSQDYSFNLAISF